MEAQIKTTRPSGQTVIGLYRHFLEWRIQVVRKKLAAKMYQACVTSECLSASDKRNFPEEARNAVKKGWPMARRALDIN